MSSPPEKSGCVRVNVNTYQAWLQVIGKGDKWTYNKLEKNWTNWGSNPSGHVWYESTSHEFWSTCFSIPQETFQDIVSNHPWIVETEHLHFFGE